MKRGSEIEVQAFAFRLDAHSGVPVYRQLIDQVQAAIASSALAAGDQLPTVRQVAVDLAINPNTVLRAYREMEIRGLLDTQQGTGTFIADKKVEFSKPRKANRATNPTRARRPTQVVMASAAALVKPTMSAVAGENCPLIGWNGFSVVSPT